jgi:hypothetical protein
MARSDGELGFDETMPGPPDAMLAARCLADRWVLGAVIGRGSSGVVHRASDRLGGPDVAVKLLDPMWDAELERIRRETTALRLLVFPGVVRLLDEGRDGGQIFVVMELVEGKPFPGRSAPMSWVALAEPTIGLFEALQGVHDAGILHRDLKPANVLVTPGGRPRILDFGLARGEALGETMTRSGVVLGTPRYVSPEQVAGAPVDNRADLYAVGVMLFEALAGRAPHVADSVQTLFNAKVFEDAPPLGGFAPDAPDAVVALVDRLISRQPAQRPDSAAEVLGIVRRIGAGDRRDSLPRLGGSAPVEALVAAALAGRSRDVAGAPGTGRSRCLREAAMRLASSDSLAIWLPAGERPFESLAPILAGVAFDGNDGASVLQKADAAVQAALEAGTVLIADDAETLDRWSAASLERARGLGAILRGLLAASGDAVLLGPLRETELQPLFAGPDRLLHRREDGARVLWERTRGLPRAVAAEVDDWVGTGVADWGAEGLLISHAALSVVRHRPLRALSAAGADISAALGTGLTELLTWISLAAPHATAGLLGEVSGTPGWQLAVELDELESLGAITRESDGRLVPRVAAPGARRWSMDKRAAAHASLAQALPVGAERRFEHVAASGPAAQVAEEVLARGRWLIDEGRLEEAMGLAQRGLVSLRRIGAKSDEIHVLRLLTQAAVATQTSAPLQTALWEIRRSGLPERELRGILALVEAWQATLEEERERAGVMAEALPPQDDEVLEAWRHALRVRLALDSDLVAAEAVIDALRPWAAAGSDEIQGRHASWEGLLRYKQSRYTEAGQHHRRAAALRQGRASRIASLANTAITLVDGFEFDAAREVATELLELARTARASIYEMYAEWALRTADYRQCKPMTPDLDLADAVEHVGDPGHSGLVLLNEAAIAWRCGQPSIASDLLGRAQALWSGDEWRWHRELGRVLAIELAGAISRDDAQLAWEQTQSCPHPCGRLQLLGALLRRTEGGAPAEWAAEARALATRFPEATSHLRFEVLAPAEANPG